jgi:RHS repeat-associated protein
LASVTTSTNTTLYRYNAFGERVAKWGAYVPSGPYRYVYDTAGHLIGEYDTNNTLRQETVYLGDMPIAVVKPGATAGSVATYNVHADHLNTPRAVLDSANTVVWRWDNTDPFGGNAANSNPDGDSVTFDYNLRFPGQYYDKETGLHYNGRRYYDPQSGRYLTPDPIGLAGGMNVYGYVGGNPVSGIDPLGLTQRDIDTARVIAMQSQGDLEFPDHYVITDLGKDLDGSNIVGYTLPRVGTQLDDSYLEKLSDKQAAELLDTIIHEAVHYSLDKDDKRQPDGNRSGYPYDQAKIRTTKELIDKLNKRRKAENICP